MATSENEQGSPSPVGEGLPVDAVTKMLDAEHATRRRLAAEDKVEVYLQRAIFGDYAYVGINGVSAKVGTNRRVKVPASFAKLLNDRQDASIAADEATRARAAARR